MERRFYYGKVSPNEIAQALIAAFNRGNLRAQSLGQEKQLIVQIATRPGLTSGGQTALTVQILKVPDGVMIELGQQTWLGVAASLGQTALSLLRNPFNMIGRLDDLAQDIESIQLGDTVWDIINQTTAAAGASQHLSDRLSRLTCVYCGTANPLGEPACLACGAPLGKLHPTTCENCGFAINKGELICPNCGRKVGQESTT